MANQWQSDRSLRNSVSSSQTGSGSGVVGSRGLAEMRTASTTANARSKRTDCSRRRDTARLDIAGEADAAALAARVKRTDYFLPDLGEGAEILEGDTDEVIEKLIELLKAKGGLK